MNLDDSGGAKCGLIHVDESGAVVTKDVEDFAVVAGNPARVLRYRLSDGQRSFHRSSGWSELAPEDALRVLDQFDG